MILLFTDFGLQGPYVGQVRSVLRSMHPQVPIVDLMHDAPVFDPKAAAYLLAALAAHWPKGASVLAVVDPGVGSDRRAIAVHAGGHWMVGPDNGLLVPAANRLGFAKWYEITWRPGILSSTFHGRDLFAPVVGQIANGDLSALHPMQSSPQGIDWPDELGTIIYQDVYGNLMTGLRPRKNRVLHRQAYSSSRNARPLPTQHQGRHFGSRTRWA